MNLLNKNIILILVFFLLLTGCKKNFAISNNQAILFQFEYTNYAWGYQHSGFIIDSEGNVLTYDNPAGWNFPDNDFYINEEELTENINQCVMTGKKIPETELKKYSSYINNIASSKITAIKNTGNDSGSMEYICYQYSEGTGMYKGSLIKMEGDFTCENLNFYSRKVASWLKNLHTNTTEIQ